MLNLLRTDYTGRGRWKTIANALNAIGQAINSLTGETGIEVYESAGEIRISGSSSRVTASGTFNGQAYKPSGDLVEYMTNTNKPWVMYDIAIDSITEQIGPPPQPFPANQKWRKKADFTGAIYF